MYDSEAIKELRRRTGLTAEEFGKLVGVTWSTVCYWERGQRHPAWKHMVKLNALALSHNGVHKSPAQP